jgi:hypothetical protein
MTYQDDFTVCPQYIWDINRHFLRDTLLLLGLFTLLLQILNSPHLEDLLLDPSSPVVYQPNRIGKMIKSIV